MNMKDIVSKFLDRDSEIDRKAMQKASFLAGLAFTRAYVGYVHALAHALETVNGDHELSIIDIAKIQSRGGNVEA